MNKRVWFLKSLFAMFCISALVTGSISPNGLFAITLSMLLWIYFRQPQAAPTTTYSVAAVHPYRRERPYIPRYDAPYKLQFHSTAPLTGARIAPRNWATRIPDFAF